MEYSRFVTTLTGITDVETGVETTDLEKIAHALSILWNECSNFYHEGFDEGYKKGYKEGLNDAPTLDEDD